MKVEKTSRGFDRIEFIDVYRQKCSLQKSSLATKDCIWLGVEATTINGKKEEVITRMHLDQKTVKELLLHLQLFVKVGEIDLRDKIENE